MSHLGNVFEPRAMDELFPEWRTMDNGPPIETEVKEDVFLVLPDDKHSVAIPQFLLYVCVQCNPSLPPSLSLSPPPLDDSKPI